MDDAEKRMEAVAATLREEIANGIHQSAHYAYRRLFELMKDAEIFIEPAVLPALELLENDIHQALPGQEGTWWQDRE